MAKKYVVDLSEEEVLQLQAILKKGKHKARSINRANILEMASEGETDTALPQFEFMLPRWKGQEKNL
jgi:hypothetical protein|nr:hypothetical protein [Trichormus azollae]